MPGHPGAAGGMMGQPVNESLQISVPNSAVGAIIGAGGANIKQIMRESGAFVNVSKRSMLLELSDQLLLKLAYFASVLCFSLTMQLVVCFTFVEHCLEYFDAVVWMAERASSL